MVRDSIADLIISVKNASERRKEQILFPFSNLHLAIAEALAREGYVQSIGKKGKKLSKFLEIKLAYGENGRSRVSDVKRISKFSRRVYTRVSNLRPVRSGTGIRILSTTKGILSDKEAKNLKVGGEVLFEIW